FFIFFFFVTLAPTANIFLLVGSIMAERFLYLPSAGLAGCCVFLLSRVKITPRITAAILAIVCVALGARTYARNLDWTDGVTLWSGAIEVNPNAARAHNNLAFEYTQIPGRNRDAIAEYQAALRIEPDYPDAHFNLGNAYLAVHQLPDAIDHFRAAAQLAP